MAETTVASLFGIKAGIVWKALNQNGASNIRNLVKATSLSREEVYGALGWLGREDKIVLDQKGRAIVFSLRTEEARLAVPEEITSEEPAPKAKSKRRNVEQPKKAKKTRTVKASVKQIPAKQSDKMEDFLLH